jgi:hypothetical protein
MTARPDLWSNQDPAAWQAALDAYEAVIDRQGSRRLPEHDRWYRNDLPEIIGARTPRHVTLDDLARIVEWKMTRGVWRARNLALAKSNDRDNVIKVSADAFAADLATTRPLTILGALFGVGPATASAVIAAVHPAEFPFYDEIVGAQIPDLPPVDFTLKIYTRYAAALRVRAAEFGPDWTATQVERALWSNAGGKAGT